MRRAKIMFALDKLFAFPGWIVMVWMLRFCRPTHPWRIKRPTWSDWTHRRTTIMRAFDFNWWVSIACLCFLVHSMLKSEWFNNLF